MQLFNIVLCTIAATTHINAHPIPLLEKFSKPIMEIADKPSTALLFIGVPGALTAWITAKTEKSDEKNSTQATQMIAAVKEKEARTKSQDAESQ
jgi:hypothetical protein